MKQLKWVGLTGGIGSGKSTVRRILESKGAPVVCADALAREVVRKGTAGLAEVVAAFGPEVLSSSGELDRKKLGAKVFADPTGLRRLEGILHPKIREMARQKRREFEGLGHTVAFYDVPLLYEKNMESLFDSVVVVWCPRDLQLTRTMARDGLTPSEVESRLQAQLPLDEKAGKADHVVRNDRTLADLEVEIDELLEKIRST